MKQQNNDYNKTAKEGENMEFNGVFHQAYDNYCYPLNEDELIINIKTGYDVKEVNIILGVNVTVKDQAGLGAITDINRR